MQEIWKPIFNGLYEVSNHGRVRRLASQVGTRPGRFIEGTITRKGYVRVQLRVEGKAVTKFLHCMVMEAFVGPKPKDFETNHKDANKLNNRLDNLEYLNKPDHRKHTVDNELMQSGDDHWARRNIGAWRGEKNNCAKLTNSQVMEIRSLCADGKFSQKDLSKRFEVSQQHINMIVNRKTRTDI